MSKPDDFVVEWAKNRPRSLGKYRKPMDIAADWIVAHHAIVEAAMAQAEAEQTLARSYGGIGYSPNKQQYQAACGVTCSAVHAVRAARLAREGNHP